MTCREETARANVTNEIFLIIFLQHVEIEEAFAAKSLATSGALIALLGVHKHNVRSKEVHFSKIFVAVWTGLR